MSQPPSSQAGPNRMTCALLAILLPGLALHRFMLGDITGGIIRIALVFACGAGAVITLVEGIIMLTKSDEVFNQTYVVEKKKWF